MKAPVFTPSVWRRSHPAGLPRPPNHEDDRPISKAKIAAGAAVVLVLGGLYWGASEAGVLSVLGDEQALREHIERLGLWGPFAIIVLIASAIVMSPIPSAPIALAAGAAYGPVWGTVFIVLGAEAGALIAFSIARCLGYEAIRHRLKGRYSFLTKDRSQIVLMGFAFVSRLVPFISFDAVSYAMGLTPLAFWRFAAATLLGIIPVSFLLAAFGEKMVTADAEQIATAILLLGGITAGPIAIKLIWDRYRRRRASD